MIRRFVIFGAPGSGKGTIAAKIVKDFGFKHISSGDLLRKNIHEGTTMGKEAKKSMDQGLLVPDHFMVDLIQSEVNKPQTAPILLDGFPRTLAQAKMLNESFPVEVALSLRVPHEVIMDRMSQRWIHFPSGRTYSYDYKPPKQKGFDDVTGEPLSQREDDKPEVVRRRLVQYDDMCSPLLQFYSASPSCAFQMEFHGKESDVIYPQVYKFLTEKVNLKPK